VEAGACACCVQKATFHVFILVYFLVLGFLRVLVFFRVASRPEGAI
jgi:hypothetical protein